MNKTISIWKSTQTVSKTGARKSTWANALGDGVTVHARVTYGRQQMQDKDGNYVLTSSVTFSVRYIPSMNEYMRIQWEDRKYRVKAIQRFPERGEMQIEGELIDE